MSDIEQPIWFDLDNTPHVPLFRPIFSELAKRNRTYVVTARDFAQTKELLQFWHIPHQLVGRHGGKNKLGKVLNLITRSTQLTKVVKSIRPSIAVSHGSRTQMIAARLLGVPSILMLDYEFTETLIFNALASNILMPEYIPIERLRLAGFDLTKVVRYPAFKEQIYLADFIPHESFRNSLGITENEILVTVRPPSTVGNYHDPRSEHLFVKTLEYLSSHVGVCCLIVNRTQAELSLAERFLKTSASIRLLKNPVDGLQLIWHSDVVISGGGTMNREAALLGVPTFSIFTGQRAYLDEFLQEQKRISFIETEQDLRRIPIVKRRIPSQYHPEKANIASIVADIILDLTKTK